jgi:Family of unknown function (DUF6535)
MEQAKVSDDQLASVLNGDLDPLLIFVGAALYVFTNWIYLIQAGLFSAILSAFLIEARRGLQPDPQTMTNTLLAELLQAQHNSTSVIPIPPPFQPASSVLWVNALWFTSLISSLMSALGASLAKGWVAQYVSVTSGTTWQDVSLRHHRFIGITRWHLKVIIQSLPLLIHIAFFLFAVGLVIVLMGNNITIGVIVLVWVAIITVLYIGSTLHPAFSPDSPFRMPVSDLLPRFTRPSQRSRRRSLSVIANDVLKAQALTWLLAESPKETVIDECIKAIHTLPPDIREFVDGHAISHFHGYVNGLMR